MFHHRNFQSGHIRGLSWSNFVTYSSMPWVWSKAKQNGTTNEGRAFWVFGLEVMPLHQWESMSSMKISAVLPNCCPNIGSGVSTVQSRMVYRPTVKLQATAEVAPGGLWWLQTPPCLPWYCTIQKPSSKVTKQTKRQCLFSHFVESHRSPYWV